MLLFHTGYQEIKTPDVRHGRKNADLGQGFYTTADQAFAERWAKEMKGEQVYVNRYELDTEGLAVKSFSRDLEWYRYIAANRSGRPDAFSEYDVVIGPIANDTIYDLMGITTSGFLSPEDSLKLLLIGPEYRQIVLKTERAVSQLTWLTSKILPEEQVRASRELLRKEEAAFQEMVAKAML